MNSRAILGVLFGTVLSFRAAAADTAGLQAGYGEMYNLNFPAAHVQFQAYEKAFPQDPLGPVSEAAAYLFSEFNRGGVLQSQFLIDDRQIASSRPLQEDPATARAFADALARADALIGAALHRNAQEPNALLAKTLRLGLHADYLALVQKRELAALKEIKQSRQIAEQLVAAHPEYADAYIAMGVENYLLSQKAAPVRWLLRATGAQTDRDTGVSQLWKTATHGRYLAPYAKVLLAVAALRRGDKRLAKDLLTWLAEQYPGNPLYKDELAKLS